MQKKIIALAIAAAVSAPAFADTSNVTVYGVANVSYDLVSVGSNTAGGAGVNANKVSSNTSRLGLKGTEDLGGGLAAAWQIESLVNIDNSNASGNTIGSRNTYLGLAGGFGTVLMGRHDTPYNIASRSMDLFTDTLADNRSLMGGAGLTTAAAATALAAAPLGAAATLAATAGSSAGAAFDGRQPDVVAYISPAMSGFTGAIAYVAGAEGAVAGQSKGSAWSLAGLYGNGPLNVNFGYEVHNIGGATGTVGIAGLGATELKESAWKLAASYTMDAFTINGVYEKTKDDFGALVNTLIGAATVPTGSDVFGHRSYYLAGKYAFGSDAVKVAYTNHGDRSMGGVAALSTNTGATQWSLGYDHSMSKRTTVYALYTKMNNDVNSAFALSGNGTGGANTANGAGADSSAFSFGMKHTF